MPIEKQSIAPVIEPFSPHPDGLHDGSPETASEKEQQQVATPFPKKVVFVLHSHQAGGAERHLLQLMQGLAEQGVQCIYAGPLDGWLGRQCEEAGFRCAHIAYHGMFDLLSVWQLVRLIRREHPDLIHGHLTRGAFYAGWASRLTSVPNVATAHSTNAGKKFGRAGRIIAVSHAVKRFLEQCGYAENSIRTVHHGVPDYALQADIPTSPIADLVGTAPVITMMARLVPAKGHDIALHALASLKEQPWQLVLAGALDTRWAADMQALAVKLAISNRVHFIGHCEHVAGVYAATDILLAPSRREALSLTLLEAAAFSLPIVATDVGGIGEAIENGKTGLLVAPENAEALAAAIARLLSDPALRVRMGMAGRRRFEKFFSTSTMTHATIKVYQDLLNEAKQ